MRPLTLLPLLSVLLLLPSQAGAAVRETQYDVTFEAQKVERWTFDEHASKDCQVDGVDGRCTRDAVGSGATRVVLRTPTPQRVTVMTGARGMQPMITASIDAGIPLKGSYLIGGTLTETYGGPWKAANPDVVAPTGGCANHVIRTDVSLAWKGRNQLTPVLLLDELHECPTGPSRGFDYETVPSVGDLAGQVSERKFGRVRQFTVRGARTWTGTVPAINRTTPDDLLTSNGHSEVRWSWEATFRMVKRKKRQRRS